MYLVDNKKITASPSISTQSAFKSEGNSVTDGIVPITTVHTRENTITGLLKDAVVSEEAGNGGVYYWQKNKARQLLSTSKVQFLGGNKIADGFIRSVSHPLSKVNTKLKSFLESLQFKNFFGDWQIKPPTASTHMTVSFWVLSLQRHLRVYLREKSRGHMRERSRRGKRHSNLIKRKPLSAFLLQLLSYMLKRSFFKTGHLCLRNTYFLSYLHLGLVVVISHIYYGFFSFRKLVHRFS